MTKLDLLVAKIRACRLCRDTAVRGALPHEPRPVLRASLTARICVCGQAPGTRVHASGKPFTDPSGDRLRTWMGVTPEEFYDEQRVAIIPMGFCFPGQDARGADLPPRSECAATWHNALFAALPSFALVLLVGQYAHQWHLKERAKASLTVTVANWREYISDASTPRYLPLPHPSWRNNAWLKQNPWFDEKVVPYLRGEIRRLL